MKNWNCSLCEHQTLCYAFKEIRSVANIEVFPEDKFPEIVSFLSSMCYEYNKRGNEK